MGELEIKTKVFNTMDEYLQWRNNNWKNITGIKEVSLDVTKEGKVLVGYTGGK